MSPAADGTVTWRELARSARASLEGRGLPDRLLEASPDRVLQIPMRTDRVRSLNLANAVSIVLYEGLRQHHHPLAGE